MNNTVRQIIGKGYTLETPKNLQQGTQNRIMMILNNLLHDDVAEATYQLVDLLDALQGEIVVSNRVAPADARAHTELLKQTEETGYERGVAAGYEKARRELRAEINNRLKGLL